MHTIFEIASRQRESMHEGERKCQLHLANSAERWLWMPSLVSAATADAIVIFQAIFGERLSRIAFAESFLFLLPSSPLPLSAEKKSTTIKTQTTTTIKRQQIIFNSLKLMCEFCEQIFRFLRLGCSVAMASTRNMPKNRLANCFTI